MTQPIRQGRRQLLLLGFLFLAPLFGAYVLFFHFPEWVPSTRTNYGELVEPARPLPVAEFTEADGGPAVDPRGRWTYVYVAAGDCDTACRDKLFQFRQIRASLNEKRDRVQRVYLAPSAEAARAARAALSQIHPDLRFLVDADGSARRFFAPSEPNAVYLLDPLGNWLMRYPSFAESRGVYKDIKRLLKVSQIG